MKSNFIDKLGITKLNSGVITIGSSFGIGRTTIFSVIAAEFYHDGKNVLFLSDDMSEKLIMKRIKKSLIGLPPNLNVCNLKIKSFHHETTIKKVIENQFTDSNYDIVIIDAPISNSIDYTFLRELSQDKKCLVINALQTKRDIPTIDTVKPNDALYKSDMMIGLSIAKPYKPSFWNVLKYFLCFWLKKPTIPNRTLKIIKNRFGKDGISVDINVDFENVKIK